MAPKLITRRAATSAVVATLALPARAQPLIPFKVGIASPSTTFLAIWMAEAAGFYKANGLAFETFDMIGGAEAGPTLSSGKIQLMHIGLSSVIRANAAGADLRAIGSLSNVVRFTLFAKEGVTSPQQLKGGTLGISSAGSESEATIALGLEKLGLTRADVTTKEIGVGRDRLNAVRSGAVTAASLNEPYRTQALEMNMIPIVDLVPDRVPWVYSGLVADAAYIKSNRDALLRFLRATVEGNHLALSDPARGKEVLAKALKIADNKVINISYKDFFDQSPRNAEASGEGAKRNIAMVAGRGAKTNVEDYCDMSFSQELAREGFYAAMQKKYGVY